MASKKIWYAWSSFYLKPPVDTNSGAILKRPKVEVGQEVTPTILGIKQDEFDELVVAGVIRSTPYPKVGRYDAPKQKLLKDARAAYELALAGGMRDDPFEDEDDEDESEVVPHGT